MSRPARIILAPFYLLFQVLVLLPVAMVCSFVFEAGETLRNSIKFLEGPR